MLIFCRHRWTMVGLIAGHRAGPPPRYLTMKSGTLPSPAVSQLVAVLMRSLSAGPVASLAEGSDYRYSVLKSYGASEKLRIESYAAPITPHRKLRRPRPLPYTPSYPPCASGRHGARSAPQGLSYTTRRQLRPESEKGWNDALLLCGNFSSDAASVYRADRALNRLVLPC